MKVFDDKEYKLEWFQEWQTCKHVFEDDFFVWYIYHSKLNLSQNDKNIFTISFKLNHLRKYYNS